MKNPFNFSSKKEKKYEEKTENVVKPKDTKKVEEEEYEVPDGLFLGADFDFSPPRKPVITKSDDLNKTIASKPVIINGDANKTAADKPEKTGVYKPSDKAKPYTFPPRVIEKKRTIILIENTSEVANYNEILLKICNSCINNLKYSDLITIIHFGKEIKKEEIDLVKRKNEKYFKCSEDAGTEKCLYDALKNISEDILGVFKIPKEKDKVITKITEIEIIGIGTCKDSGSKTSRQDAIDCFCKMIKDTKATTKYFCLNENSFLDAAELGFRSIGSISRSY